MNTKLCGIYCIKNILNNKKYIGMSRDIDRRWIEHKSELKSHNHANQYLQRAWDKYGDDCFLFYIIELCDESFLSEKECYYIRLYISLSHENGYNLTTGGENTSVGKPVISLKDSIVYNFVHEAARHANVSDITMISWCRKKQNYMYLDDFDSLSQEERDYWCSFDWDKFNHNQLSKAHSREKLSSETRKKLSIATSGKTIQEHLLFIVHSSTKYLIV